MKRACLVVGLLAACTQVDRKGQNKPPAPNPVVQPAVEAKILSVVLADDCRQADLANEHVAPGGAAGKAKMKREMKADSAGGGARPCEQSRVQIALKAGAGDVPLHVKVASVKVFHEETGKFLEDLVPRNPQLWSDATQAYQPWDQTVAPGAALTTSFDLTAPDWDRIGGGSRWNTDGMNFRLSVSLEIEGQAHKVEYVLASPFITREPMVKP